MEKDLDGQTAKPRLSFRLLWPDSAGLKAFLALTFSAVYEW